MNGALLVSLLPLSGCFSLVDEADTPRIGQLASDYRVTETRVVAVRSVPALAPAGEPRTLEALVMGPRPIQDVSFEVCGFNPIIATEVTSLRCFELDSEVLSLGSGNPLQWEVPEASYEGCVPFDDTDRPQLAGAWCTARLPLLAWAVDDEGSVAVGGNYIQIPDREVPEDYVREEGNFPQPDPSKRVTLEQFGEVAAGGEVELVTTFEDPLYDRAAWWIDGGTLLDSGRTAVDPTEPGAHRTYNRLRIPDDWRGPLQVAVVLTDTWLNNNDGDDDLGNETYLAVSQPGWATLTLEVP